MSEPAPENPRRLPVWLKRRLPAPGETARVGQLLARLSLNTVCSGAHCPNQSECFARGVATFMILGEVCTRHCRFCAVPSGEPQPVREDEPQAVAAAAAELGLRHVVITSVTRDDLADGGAGSFARTIRAVRAQLPHATVEVLTPDFLGRDELVDAVIDAGPSVFNHNIETVERLTPQLRPQAGYRRSLGVLACAAERARQAGPAVLVKSGLMLGLGESEEEILATLRDLLAVGCRALTLGQYLAPSPQHEAVRDFIPPEQFDRYGQAAREMGFTAVASGPFVRSSYHADALYAGTRPGRDRVSPGR